MTYPTQQPFAAPGADPFADPVIPPSTHPTIGSFRGRLVMITPRKSELIPDNLNAGKMVTRITADVSVVDGAGPVPQVKGNPPQLTGQYLEGPDFTGVWIQSERIVQQIEAFVGTGRPVLGVIDTRNPGTAPMKGNPWGIIAATPEQRAQAVQFLASRTIGGAAAPAPQSQPAPVTYPMQATQQPAPVYGAPVSAAAPQQPAPVIPAAAPVPAQAPPTVPAVPAPGSAPAGVNPFASPAQQPAGVNPFTSPAQQPAANPFPQ